MHRKWNADKKKSTFEAIVPIIVSTKRVFLFFFFDFETEKLLYTKFRTLYILFK